MRQSRLAPLLGALVALLIAGLAAAAFVLIGNTDSRAVVVQDDSTPVGSKALEYRGVRVDVPVDWDRIDPSDCEFEFERWGPPGAEPCDPDATGVAFYGSATFDPDVGPGLQRSPGPPKFFSGYVLVGDWAVYVSGPEKRAAAQVLASARIVDVNRPTVG